MQFFNPQDPGGTLDRTPKEKKKNIYINILITVT